MMRLQPVDKSRLYTFILFSLTTAISIFLLVLRIHFTAKVTFIFLVWNIFLAFIPYFITTLLSFVHHRFNRWLLFIPFAIWLCFFPNAPYILTDLFHLKQRSGVPFWYDLALILFFAFNGLMMGYASLLDMQEIISAHFSKWLGWVVIIGSVFLSSFGIYLGRYLRWNSWDVISAPKGLMQDIVARILDPMAHPQTFGVTIVFFAFLLFGYLVIYQLTRTYQQPKIDQVNR